MDLKIEKLLRKIILLIRTEISSLKNTILLM